MEKKDIVVINLNSLLGAFKHFIEIENSMINDKYLEVWWAMHKALVVRSMEIEVWKSKYRREFITSLSYELQGKRQVF